MIRLHFTGKGFVSTALACLLFSGSTLSAQAGKASVKKSILRGQVTQTSDYCGGAMPSPQILESLKQPQPLSNKTLCVKQGKTNDPKKPILLTVSSDSNGFFSFKLPMGTYCLIEEEKTHPFVAPENTEYMTWDLNCLRERYRSADLIFTVKAKGNQLIKINFHQPCFYKPYCGEYTGPLPP